MLRKMTFLVLIIFTQISLASTGPYEAKVKRIQATDIGNPYNTIYLDVDVTDSPCGSTNVHNRFTLKNEAQYSMALSAFMGDIAVKIYGTGACVSGIEQINNMQIER